MLLKIDTASSIPIYAQIVEQIKRAIASGALRGGDPLPSLRETALKLRINPLTVDKAYKLLERDGLVETKHGLGTFITITDSFVSDGFRMDVLSDAVDKLLIDAIHLGVTVDELKTLLDKRSKAISDVTAHMTLERRSEKDDR